jgi:hypothetical protein
MPDEKPGICFRRTRKKYKTGNVGIKVTLRRVHDTTDATEKPETYILTVSVVFAIQHAKCVHHITVSVVCLVLPYFSTLSHYEARFVEKSY